MIARDLALVAMGAAIATDLARALLLRAERRKRAARGPRRPDHGEA